jgi:predicted AlkP superfamily phosphohydrolase/phosphomutase
MPTAELERKRPHRNFAVSALAAWFFAVASVSLVLSLFLLRANGFEGGAAHLADLFATTFWIAGVLNAGFLAVSLAMWPLISAKVDRASRWGCIAYFSSGLLALNVAWILWNHLQMAHQLLSRRPFITATGAVEIAGIGLTTLLVWFGAAGIAGKGGGARRFVVVGTGIVTAVTLLLLDAHEAGWQRVYTHQEIAATLEGLNTVPSANTTTAARGPVILIGVDGLSWGVVYPLIRNGKLPALAELLSRGSFGYLDNGGQSISPPIWMTIFTGRPKEIHGVHDYRKWVLAAPVRPVLNLRTVNDAFDVFYGLNHLIQRLPSLGLWSVEFVSSHDRRVPTIWEVLGSYGKRVAVVNPIANMPFGPVNGAIVNLAESWESGSTAYQPKWLAEKWGKEPVSGSIPLSVEAFEELSERLSEEVDFALDLFRDQEIDLGIFYTHFIDTVSHFNWDFHSPGEIYLKRLPRDLSDHEWEQTVMENSSDRAFRCYVVFDQQLRRFMDAFPGATFILVSDHGWTYSGYEHFGSPDGMISLSGPGVRPGEEIRGASIEDIAPTIYALLDVPLSSELSGKLLDAAFDSEFAVDWVDSYDASLISAPPDAKGTVDDSEAERLRAIGYID